MIIKIPDEYVTLVDLLDRNGIPYEIIEEKGDE